MPHHRLSKAYLWVKRILCVYALSLELQTLTHSLLAKTRIGNVTTMGCYCSLNAALLLQHVELLLYNTSEPQARATHLHPKTRTKRNAC
jgi:hypothetical protein